MWLQDSEVKSLLGALLLPILLIQKNYCKICNNTVIIAKHYELIRHVERKKHSVKARELLKLIEKFIILR